MPLVEPIILADARFPGYFQQAIAPNGVCLPPNQIDVEVVWAQDATQSHRDTSWSHLRAAFPNMETKLSKASHSTRFAFASFADYRVSEREADFHCYRFYRPLSSDIRDTVRSWNECKEENGLYSDSRASLSGLTALAMDSRMKWTTDPLSSSGSQVIRIIVVSTGHSYLPKEVPEIRSVPELIAEGIDSCSTTEPSLKTVKRMLDEKDIHLLALVDKRGAIQWKKYKEVLNERLTVNVVGVSDLARAAGEKVYNLVEKIRCSRRKPQKKTRHVSIDKYSGGNGNKCVEVKDIFAEFVWTQDASYSCMDWQSPRTAFRNLFLALKNKGAVVKGALTSFIDYGIRESRNVQCYYFFKGLSSNLDEALHTFEEYQRGYGLSDDDESAMSGVLLSATDKRMGWSTGLQDASGRRHLRIIVVFTDHGSILEGMLPYQPKWKGDGTDSCQNDAPSLEMVKKILDEKDIHLVAFIAPSGISEWKKFKTVLGDRLYIQEATLTGTGTT